MASSFQLAAGWFLTILLCVQLCVVLFQHLHKKEYSKAINTGLILGGGTLSIAGSISRMTGRAALGAVLSGWGLILMLGGALLEYLQDHGPLGDWLEKCYWNKNSPLYSSDDEEKLSYKKNQYSGEVRHVVMRFLLPVWRVTATYTDRNNILCSAPERTFRQYLTGRDKPGEKPLLSTGKR